MQVYLDLFSGPNAPVARQIEELDEEAMAWDTLRDKILDVTAHPVRPLLRKYLKNGKIGGSNIALPCGSWSSARHGNDRGGAKPLRDRTPKNIYGFPSLSPLDKGSLLNHHQCARILKSDSMLIYRTERE